MKPGPAGCIFVINLGFLAIAVKIKYAIPGPERLPQSAAKAIDAKRDGCSAQFYN
jgi:hypothetical protein